MEKETEKEQGEGGQDAILVQRPSDMVVQPNGQGSDDCIAAATSTSPPTDIGSRELDHVKPTVAPPQHSSDVEMRAQDNARRSDNVFPGPPAEDVSMHVDRKPIKLEQAAESDQVKQELGAHSQPDLDAAIIDGSVGVHDTVMHVASGAQNGQAVQRSPSLSRNGIAASPSLNGEAPPHSPLSSRNNVSATSSPTKAGRRVRRPEPIFVSSRTYAPLPAEPPAPVRREGGPKRAERKSKVSIAKEGEREAAAIRLALFPPPCGGIICWYSLYCTPSWPPLIVVLAVMFATVDSSLR